jgi:DNA-binding transcriptional MerR regulator
MDKLTVGQLAKQARTTPKTVRYYERIGLLLPAARGANQYRYYDDVHVRQLRFIRRAQRLGLTLAEIGQLVKLAQDARCTDVRASLDELLTHKIREYELRIAALQTLRRHIQPTEGEGCVVCQAAFGNSCACLPSPTP